MKQSLKCGTMNDNYILGVSVLFSPNIFLNCIIENKHTVLST